ncbi:MAG: primosomal protein N', partial [Planctomycetota bacterium]
MKSQAGTRLYKFVAIADDGRKALEIGSLRPKQQAVLSLLAGRDEPWRADKLAASAECGSGVILNLEKKGLVEAVRLRDDNLTFKEGPAEPHTAVELTDEQRAALDAIVRAIRGDPAEAIPGRQPGDASDSPGNSSDRGNERLTALPDIRGLTPPGSPTSRTILLHGVTGSGKTEVYIRAIEEVVSYGRQAIVLVPEISLTPQTIRRFRSRFKGVAVLHSHLTDAERHHQWRRIARGEIQVVVGARSAVFAPTPRLGLIVIDEEHETSFKQDTTPRYHAREVAERRAAAAAVPLILGSATPTLESWRRAATGRYRLVSMPSRVDDLPMPPVTIVDVRNDPQIKKGHAIGRVLESTMRTALGDDGQVILFLNVRGHSPAVWCPACGASLKCLDCDITLTWHKDLRLNLCHSCGVESEVPRSCPECGHTGLKFVGIGTQKLEAEVRAKFAGVPLARMDSDAMKKPGSHDEVLSAFRSGDLKILLGTQMIAKGLDFPNVTLVGVVDADTTLRQPDLRASERTFQLIAQVAGRTGRSRRGGRVLVQSSSPAEPAIRLTRDHDYVTF